MFYRAWVPTVSGRLSFKIVGEARYPTQAEAANVSTVTHQYVLVSQVRNLSDVLFEWLLGPLLGISGKFTFYYAARMRRDGETANHPLVGRIFIARKYKKQKLNFTAFLNRLRPVELLDADATGRDVYLEALKAIGAHSDISANVILHRDGTTGISKLRWHDATLQSNSMNYSAHQATDLDHAIADQIYFFLRDISHQHQHHGADADTIIQTQKSEGQDLGWANNIVYALYLYMINAKRRDDSLEHVRVLGVLAYVKSFKQIIALRAYKRSIDPPVPEFNDAALAESINATRSYIELLQARKKQRLDQSRTVLFAVVAALFSLFTFMTSFAEPGVPAPHPIVQLANLLKQNAYLSGFPILAMLVWWLSSKVLHERYDFKRDVVRLAFTARRRFSAVAIIAALALAYVAWTLFPAALVP